MCGSCPGPVVHFPSSFTSDFSPPRLISSRGARLVESLKQTFANSVDLARLQRSPLSYVNIACVEGQCPCLLQGFLLVSRFLCLSLALRGLCCTCDAGHLLILLGKEMRLLHANGMHASSVRECSMCSPVCWGGSH